MASHKQKQSYFRSLISQNEEDNHHIITDEFDPEESHNADMSQHYIPLSDKSGITGISAIEQKSKHNHKPSNPTTLIQEDETNQ